MVDAPAMTKRQARAALPRCRDRQSPWRYGEVGHRPVNASVRQSAGSAGSRLEIQAYFPVGSMVVSFGGTVPIRSMRPAGAEACRMFQESVSSDGALEVGTQFVDYHLAAGA